MFILVLMIMIVLLILAGREALRDGRQRARRLSERVAQRRTRVHPAEVTDVCVDMHAGVGRSFHVRIRLRRAERAEV